MPIIKSAKKRVRIANKAKIRNLRVKRSLRDAIKALEAKVDAGKNASGELSAAYSKLDIAVKKKIIHKKKAARNKKHLANLAKSTAKSPAKTKSSKPKVSKTKKQTTSAKKTSAKKPSPKKTTRKSSRSK